MDQYKFGNGPLAGMWKQTMQTLCSNVAWTAYQSTPGAPIKDYNTNGGKFMRPISEEEAGKIRPDFQKHAQEFSDRDPDGYVAWRSAYNDWRSSDLSASMPNPEKFLTK